MSYGEISLESFIPHYAIPPEDIMGYSSYLLPIPFQDLTFEVQRTLFRGFDRMELSAFRQVNDVLPGAAQDLRRFHYVDDSVGGKVSEISRRQRNTFADPVEHRI